MILISLFYSAYMLLNEFNYYVTSLYEMKQIMKNNVLFIYMLTIEFSFMDSFDTLQDETSEFDLPKRFCLHFFILVIYWVNKKTKMAPRIFTDEIEMIYIVPAGFDLNKSCK